MSNHAYWLAWNRINGIGAATILHLRRACGDLETAWKLPALELKQLGLSEAAITAILEQRPRIDPGTEVATCKALAISTCTIDDPEYPGLLKHIHLPPPLLYYYGSLSDIQRPISIVGTRMITPYGRQVVKTIVEQLSYAGCTIISGLAFGVDGAAHQAALDNQSKTIAVIASGLRHITPSSQWHLAQRIINEGGAIISEIPPDIGATKQSFPRRNRIIAGLGLGTLVVEAGKKSGSLITARFALESNRDVFAIPGSIFSEVSTGTNELIAQGAQPIRCGNDILKALNISQEQTNKTIVRLNRIEQEVLSAIPTSPTHIDDIVATTKLATHSVNATLSLLELKGAVVNLGSNKYQRNS